MSCHWWMHQWRAEWNYKRCIACGKTRRGWWWKYL